MINTKDKIFYGFGNFSYGTLNQGLILYLVFFGTTILNISGTLIGLIIAVSVVWDALTDPVVGYISDNTIIGRWGRRHFYMMIGAIGLSLSNYFIWTINPSYSNQTKALLFFLLVIIVKTFLTIYVTPYNALGAELSNDYDERTSIQGYRTLFFTLGLAFTSVVSMLAFFSPTETYSIGQLNPVAYRNMGLTISIIVLVLAFVAIVDTMKFIPQLPKNIDENQEFGFGKIFDQFKGILKNKDYLNVLGAYLSANLSSAILSTIGLHVFTYTFLMDNTEMSVVFGSIFVMSILSQAFWVNRSKKMDKKNAALLAVFITTISAIIFLLLVFLRDLVINQYLLLLFYSVPSGVGLGGLITLPYSMIADTIDEEELQSGNRTEGMYYGGMTFSYKISQSIAIFLLGIILDLVKFDANLVVQTNLTSMALGLILGIGTIAALLTAWFFYKRYTLTKEKSMKIKRQLELIRNERI